MCLGAESILYTLRAVRVARLLKDLGGEME